MVLVLEAMELGLEELVLVVLDRVAKAQAWSFVFCLLNIFNDKY